MSSSLIGNPDFGMGIDPTDFITRALKSIPKLNCVDGRMVMQELYETEYGIHNHLDPRTRRPLASVAMHPAEDINTGSWLENSFRAYASKGIGDIFKISVFEFMEMPLDIIEMMIRIADEEVSKKSKVVDEINDQFKK